MRSTLLSRSERCTCRFGRDYDGSEFGPCEYCERKADDEREQAALIRDAARWRMSRIKYDRTMDSSLGYFCVELDSTVIVGIQPHPVTNEKSVNACTLGRGQTEGVAIDRMFDALNDFVEQGARLPAEIETLRAMRSTPATTGGRDAE